MWYAHHWHPWSYLPPEHTGPDIWTILTALGTLAAVFAALFVALLPKLDAYRHRPRLSLAVAPILVVAVGSLVGFVVLAMFLPLIQLLTRLSE